MYIDRKRTNYIIFRFSFSTKYINNLYFKIKIKEYLEINLLMYNNSINIDNILQNIWAYGYSHNNFIFAINSFIKKINYL
jgi:hypothetical protein